MKDCEKGLAEYYKDLYENEKKKNEALTRQLVAVETDNAEMHRKINLLKNSLIYKVLQPPRIAWSHFKNLCVRLYRLGSLGAVIDKLKQKRIEKNAYRFHGTMSFPGNEEILAEKNYKFVEEHIFSILVPLYNTPEKFLREMIESVINQTYSGWELCLADGSDSEHSYVKAVVDEYIESDSKVFPDRQRIKYKKLDKNEGISGNTNECFTIASGDYIGLFDHDDLLHPSVLYQYMLEISRSNADYLYCDEATFKGESIDNMVTMHFKPDFSIDNLRANNYICHFSVFTRELFETVGGFRSEFDGSQDHDMILRLTDKARHIVHVPHILYYWRAHENSTAADIGSKTYAIEAAKGAVAAHLTSHGFKDFEIESTRAFPTIFRIRYAIPKHDLISIIIPNRDHAEDLKNCTESILSLTSYDNYEIIIVENGSREAETEKYYNELKKCPCVRIFDYTKETQDEAFNFSRLINFGAAKAEGRYLLLLNNDTAVITRDWLENMLMYAEREDVGAVGAKLYYADFSIQHAGIVIGLGAHRTAGHSHYKLGRENLGYMGRLCYAQNMSAVTGACMMTKKKDFDSVGGFDEAFAIALNDVDYCLKLRAKGLLNIFTPFAELFHYESVSRGDDTNPRNTEKAKRYEEESALFRERYKDLLAKGDPYFNPNFSLDHSNFTLKASPAPMVS